MSAFIFSLRTSRPFNIQIILNQSAYKPCLQYDFFNDLLNVLDFSNVISQSEVKVLAEADEHEVVAEMQVSNRVTNTLIKCLFKPYSKLGIVAQLTYIVHTGHEQTLW